MITLSKKRFAILLAVMVIQPLLGLAVAANQTALQHQAALVTAAVSSAGDARMLDVAIMAIETGERSPEKLVGVHTAAEVVEWKTKATSDRDAAVKQLAEEGMPLSSFGRAVITAQFVAAVLTFAALVSRTTIAGFQNK